MSVVKHAVIAAAGLGSRLGLGKPKCLIEISGEPLLAQQLKLLKDIEDVRVVVGFEELAVIELAYKIREDVIIVRNPAYRSTMTIQSYALGAQFLKEPCLYMDADIYFEPESFNSFITHCKYDEMLIAITSSKTMDAVYVHKDNNDKINEFSREKWAPFEWANLAWLPPKYCEGASSAVFERLSQELPLSYREITSFEIDTPEDMAIAMKFAGK